MFFNQKLRKGIHFQSHVRKKVRLFSHIELLGSPFPEPIAIDIILHSLYYCYAKFKEHYLNASVENTLGELLNILKMAEMVLNNNDINHSR